MENDDIVYRIYVLKDALDNVRYVGITKQSLITRLNKHYNTIKNGKRAKVAKVIKTMAKR